MIEKSLNYYDPKYYKISSSWLFSVRKVSWSPKKASGWKLLSLRMGQRRSGLRLQLHQLIFWVDFFGRYFLRSLVFKNMKKMSLELSEPVKMPRKGNRLALWRLMFSIWNRVNQASWMNKNTDTTRKYIFEKKASNTITN